MAMRAWHQEWRDLLFVHWPVAAATLRQYVPEALELEEFDGSAWIGLTPFWIGAMGLFAGPRIRCRVPETNLRTYVRFQGRPGVWFFTLDITSRLAVAGGRGLYKLPYRHASMEVSNEADRVVYQSRRDDGSGFAFRYRPIGPVSPAAPGSLEHWLTERYTLFSATDRGAIFRADIEHRPWPLQPAELTIERNEMPIPGGGTMPDPPLHLRYAGCLEVAIELPALAARFAPRRTTARPLRTATTKG